MNMNYSIIFTEISFSPETSILLQIIQIIHMAIWIIQNLTEKGGQVVRSGSKVVYTMRQTQTRTCPDSSPRGLSRSIDLAKLNSNRHMNYSNYL